MKKILAFLLFSLLFLLNCVGIALQIPYFQNQLKVAIEKKSGGSLSVGKLRGVLPLWVELEDVHYRDEKIDVTLDHLSLLLSPTSLCTGKLSFLHAYTPEVRLEKKERERLPHTATLGIEIQKFHIDTLEVQGIRFHEIRGSLFHQPLPTLHCTAHSTNLAFRLSVVKEEGLLSFIGKVEKKKDALWMSGTYTPSSGIWNGEGYGNLQGWRIASQFQKTGTLLSLTHTSVTPPDKEPLLSFSEGAFSYESETHRIKGTIPKWEHAFSLEGLINITPSSFSLTELSVDYLAHVSHAPSEEIAALPRGVGPQRGEESVLVTRTPFSESQILRAECATSQREEKKYGLGSLLTGSLSYSEEAAGSGWSGALSFVSPDLSLLFPPLSGEVRGDLLLEPERMVCRCEATQIAAYGLFASQAHIEIIEEKGLSYSGAIEGIVVRGAGFGERVPPLSCTFEGAYENSVLSVQGALQEWEKAPLCISASLPFPWSRKEGDTTYTFTIEGKAPLALLLAPWQQIAAQGEVDVHLSLQGGNTLPAPLARISHTPSEEIATLPREFGSQRECEKYGLEAITSPESSQRGGEKYRLEGEISCEGGYLESMESGMVMKGLSFRVVGEGQGLRIVALSAQDQGKGTLSASGLVGWDPLKGSLIDLQILTHRFTLFALDTFTAVGDSTLTLTRGEEGLLLSGEATLTKGVLSLPEKLPLSLPILEVTYTTPLPEHPTVANSPPLGIRLDVMVHAPKHFYIEGRGITAEWGGHLSLSGTGEKPSYAGKLRLIQGRFSLAGHTFSLTEGKILIEGLAPKELFVDLKGDVELATLTASLLVRGSVENLRVTLASTPPMSTQQILSWILFNQDIHELTPFQACRLANTLVSLSGKYGKPKVFDTIREGLGLDVFDITHCNFDTSDFTFQVGKYLSQGTFVGINKSLSGNFDSIEIQMRLLRNFFLEANYGGSLNSLTPSGGKFIFKWYKTY